MKINVVWSLSAVLFLAGNQGLAANSEEEPAAPVFPEALVNSGAEYFIANCAFCHGRDAQGGSRGLDLTRSELAEGDQSGELIGAVIRSGRADKGMPAFAAVTASELEAVSAFIHVQRYIAETANGGRRSVEPADLAVGDATRGENYFNQHCISCHSPEGDLQGIASRQGLGLLMSMLNPGSGRGGPPAPRPILAVTTEAGELFIGELAYRDEFSIAMRDSSGRWRSWSTDTVDYRVDDPLQAHIDQLALYTDEDMHDVYAYLLTLNGGE